MGCLYLHRGHPFTNDIVTIRGFSIARPPKSALSYELYKVGYIEITKASQWFVLKKKKVKNKNPRPKKKKKKKKRR